MQRDVCHEDLHFVFMGVFLGSRRAVFAFLG